MRETFTYDEMNRLTGVTLKRPSEQDLECAVTYDALGRMTSKQAVTSVNGVPQVTSVFSIPTFDPSRVHAMASASVTDGVSPPTAHTVSYTGFDKVRTVKQGNDSVTYTYGFDHHRIFAEEHFGNAMRTKRYVGNCEYATQTVGNVTTEKWLTYLTGPTGVYAVVVTENNDDVVHFVLKDNLGSWTTVTDVDGIVEQRLSYDAWGNPRDPNTWSGSFMGTLLFDRGFTGHEHLSHFGLINMSGRMYDPVMSSFLSVDQYVQSPEDAQGFNRYAYCANNPLRYVDPSGWEMVMPPGGYTPNTANANNPYAYAPRSYEPRDLGMLQLDTSDPIITWMEENEMHGGGTSGGFYVNLATGLIEHHDGQSNFKYLKQGLLFLANTDASIGEIEDALQQKGFTFSKDPNVIGGYVVDTREAYQGWHLWQSMPLFVAFFGGMIADETVSYLSLTVNNKQYTIDPKKFDYFFGKVHSNRHNTTRSLQNLKDLEELGITNRNQLRRILQDAISEGTVVTTKTNSFGTTVIRRVEIGEYGHIEVSFFYQSNNFLDTPKVTTIIPKIH